MRLSSEIETMADRNGELVRAAAEMGPPKARTTRRSLLERAIGTDAKRKAMDRYLADEVAAEHANTADGLKPRIRWDVALLRHGTWKAINVYEMITSFIGYHLGGVVTRLCFGRRAAFCRRCTFRKRRYSVSRPAEIVQVGTPLDWRDKCHGPGKGQPCGCPDDLAWKPAALIWKLWLRLFGCPCGHWDRGGYAPEPPTGDGPICEAPKSCESCGG